MTKMNLPPIVDATSVEENDHVGELERRVKSLEGELEEARKLIQVQSNRINSDLAMKMAIAKLLA